jgi:hypothetical protein
MQANIRAGKTMLEGLARIERVVILHDDATFWEPTGGGARPVDTGAENGASPPGVAEGEVDVDSRADGEVVGSVGERRPVGQLRLLGASRNRRGPARRSTRHVLEAVGALRGCRRLRDEGVGGGGGERELWPHRAMRGVVVLDKREDVAQV